MTATQWPDPNSSRADVATFITENAPPPEPEHEAPEVENGPSIVCNACGVIRVSLFTPFCKGCKSMMKAAGIL